MRQNVKRAARNRSDKTVIKNELRKVNEALGGKDVKIAETSFRVASAILDRSANKKVMHPNTAARRKSRLARRLNAMKGAK
jgi:small subunit ribosomal protein S20